MTREYIVLTDVGPGFQAEAGVRSAVKPSLTFETLTPDEVQAKGRTRLLLPVMPLRAIRPTRRAAAPPPTGPATAWGVAAVGATAPAKFTGKGVVVAVLDTGIDRHHAAFKGVTIEEEDFTGEGNGDSDGHGTHVAGTIFGRPVNGQAIGVAPGVTKALIGKVLGKDGGSTKGIYQAIDWAMERGANIISMSLGIDPYAYWQALRKDKLPPAAALSEVLADYRMALRCFDRLIAYLQARSAQGDGAIVVAATGNESEHGHYAIGASLPAAADGILSVGAFDAQGRLASFSNTRPLVMGPGVDILSAEANSVDGGLVLMDGTSMATPHVAGVAACWWQALAEDVGPLTATGVVARIQASASRAGFDPALTALERGFGRVRVPTKEDFE